MIRKISMRARLDLEKILEIPVELFLFIKVRKEWQDDPERFAAMGLNYRDGEE